MISEHVGNRSRRQLTAVPSGGNATMSLRASETIWRTRALRTDKRVLVGVVSTIVITVTQPIRLDANVCVLAF